MRRREGAGATGLLLALAVGVSAAQQSPDPVVISSDPELEALASSLLPDLAERSGLELKGPVRLERRSREHLVTYLESKLDEELPPADAKAMVDAYALLGLVPADLDLRAVLLALYTEQVAGFYEPDSTALFVLDDQPRATLEGLLVHELVHAIQDQNTDLDAITDRALGNDRATAAQAAIEGHATLVMLEFMTERLAGVAIDLAEIPNFSAQMRPALEGMRGQFPALSGAPRVIQESLLFAYLEGTAFVQELWAAEGRVAPFGERLPLSTEQVLAGSLDDPPLELEISVASGRVVREDVLGRLETGVFLDEHLGPGSADLADGWDGDRYALVEREDGGRGLVWFVLWEDEAGRDAFVREVGRALPSFDAAEIEALDAGGRALSMLRVGPGVGFDAEVRVAGAP